ncbi:MFS transporter [Candidatus Curtissbacteria bacterium]|nr:MFS transporter [Candidatus Curtissbacteria bacterium]
MSDALRTKDQILFAVGGFGENVTFQAVSAWLIFFWSGQGNLQNALVPIGILGVLLGIGRFIEAFDDPLIGHLSDRTKSRWGRRFPYIFFGAPLLAFSFFLLWIGGGWSVTLNAIYFFVALQFFFFAYTLVSAPYEGILPEIALTSRDRVATSAWRVLFGVIGAGLGLVGSGILISLYGFAMMGAVLAVAALVAFWIAILGIRKRLSTWRVLGLRPRSSSVQTSLFQALVTTLKNEHFVVFSLAFILFSLGLNLLTALMPFYVVNLLRLPEGQTALFMALVLGSMLLALPVQTKLANIFGKKKIYAYSMLILGLLFPLLFLTGLTSFNPFWQTVAVVVAIGLVLSGQFVFPNAILADVIDYDANLTGLRREAIYYGMQNTLQKFSFALSSLIFGTTLAVFGATVDNSMGIRLIGPIAGLVTLLGFVIFVKWYRLPDQIK